QGQVSTDRGKSSTNPGVETSPRLSFTATAPTSGNEYRPMFVNFAGFDISSPATLTVYTPPSIPTQPTDQTVHAGQTATFTAAASGVPSPTVQWLVSTNGASVTPLQGANPPAPSFTAPLSPSGDRCARVFAH